MFAYCTCNGTLGITLMSDINKTNTITTLLLTLVNADQCDTRNSELT